MVVELIIRDLGMTVKSNQAPHKKRNSNTNHVNCMIWFYGKITRGSGHEVEEGNFKTICKDEEKGTQHRISSMNAFKAIVVKSIFPDNGRTIYMRIRDTSLEITILP